MVPLLPLTLLFLLGVTLGLAVPNCPVTWLALGTGLVFGVTMVSPARFFLLCLFCLGAGATAGGMVPAPRGARPARSRQPVDAVVATRPAKAPGGCRVDVSRVWLAQRQGWRAGPAKVTLRLRGPCPTLVPGNRLRFRTRLRPGPRGRPWRGTVPPGGFAHVGEANRPTKPPLTARIRAAALARIAPWTSPGRGLVGAVVVGDRQWLGVHERARFRRTGTAHLLAISGLHVGLVTGICFWLMRRLWGLAPPLALRLAPTRAAAAFALATTWLFVAISGAATPALRAGIMTTALLLGSLWGRRSNAWASLALAAVVLLLWDPSQLATPGFQLSFTAVAAILAVTRTLRAWTTAHRRPNPAVDPGPQRSHRWRSALIQLCGVTAAATLATLPLVAHHFGQASGAGLFLNLVVVPFFAAVVVPLGLAGTVLALVYDPAGQLVLGAAGQSAELLQGLVAWGDKSLSSWLHLRWRPSGVETACCYAAALGLGWIRRPRGRILLAGALVVGLASAAFGTLGPGGGATLRVVFLDVGKGDAALITFPDGRHALVDAPGPTRSGWSATRRRVLPALDRLGVRRLHLVIASHAHADHIGGLPAVLERFPTGALWHSGQITTAPEARRLTASATDHSVPLRPARNRSFGTVSMTVVGPRLRGRVHPHPLRSANDNSLVILVRHPAGSVLFTGDLEQPGEAALVSSRRRHLLGATVLKVGHHGSPTATSVPFLRTVSPRLAILSAPGARPGRPFPSPRVLGRLRRHGARPLVTGQEGDITVTISPWGITYHANSGTHQLTKQGWRPAPPWPTLTAILKDPRILLP
jgi:competence protein ComEC